MKRYIVGYWNIEKTNPEYLFEISNIGIKNGYAISFLSGKKFLQGKYKNDFRNGICKYWSWYDTQNFVLSNWKKHKRQRIEIRIK